MNSRFSGSSGFGSWFGNDPSGSKKQRTVSTIGRRSSTGGSSAPAIPFAASMTTFSGRTADTSMKDITRSTYCGQTSTCSTVPGVASRQVAATARSRTSRSPDSPPTGSAPRRTIFIPV